MACGVSTVWGTLHVNTSYNSNPGSPWRIQLLHRRLQRSSAHMKPLNALRTR